MLTLKQLSKQYHSQNGHIVYALDNINLSFPNTGMIFILGSSGSGKTTLLNIIGGLNQASSGEMKVDNQSLDKATEKQLNQYRNRYIGFIFQDSNLINDITIYDNLALACFASTLEEERKQISDALSQVGLQDYESRYPSEISGGEFQRIAIARALLKDSKILLADEPTGYFNSELSKPVFDILKSISATRLVIVVTHNEELAKQYGERAIHLRDGKVIADSQEVKDDVTTIAYDTTFKNKPFNKIAFKIAIKTMTKKKAFMVLNFLILILGFSLVTLSYVFTLYDRPYVDYRNIYSLQETHFVLGQGLGTTLRKGMIDELSNQFDFDYIQDYKIDSIQKLIDMGYVLKPGYQELTYDGIVAGVYWIDRAFSNSNIFNDSTGLDLYNAPSLDYSQVVGKYIYLEGYDETYQICGIIDTLPTVSEQDTYAYDQSNFYYSTSSMFSLPISKYQTNFEQKMFLAQSHDDYSFGMNITLNQTLSYESYKVTKEYTTSSNFDAIIDQNGIINQEAISNKLMVNQAQGVYLSLNLYNLIFNENFDISHYVGPRIFNESSQTYQRELRVIPNHIGENFSFGITDQLSNDSSYEINHYQILGVIMTESDLSPLGNTLVVQSAEFNNFYDVIRDSRIIINIQTISKKDVLAMFRYLYRYDIFPTYSATLRIQDFNLHVKNISSISLFISALALLSILLSNVLFINQSLKSRQKEIAILHSLGKCRAEIIKIFVMQVGVISFVSWLLTSFLSIFIIRIVNYLTIYSYNPSIKVVVYHPIIMLYLFIFIAIINGLSTLLPIIKESSQSIR